MRAGSTDVTLLFTEKEVATIATYPARGAYERGLLGVGQGHHVYWEAHGSPDGKPALVIHGARGLDSPPEPPNSSTRIDIGSCSTISAIAGVARRMRPRLT